VIEEQNMVETRQRVIDVLAEVLNKPTEILVEANDFIGIPDWDSLYHLNIVLGLEKEFSVKFDINEVMEITSIDSAVTLIELKIQI
jgi:acyl carrier protein